MGRSSSLIYKPQKIVQKWCPLLGCNALVSHIHSRNISSNRLPQPVLMKIGQTVLWYGSLILTNENLLTIKLYFMLRWTLIFLVIAIIAAIFGFGGIAAGAASIAKILFYIFLVLFVLSLIAGGFRRVD